MADPTTAEPTEVNDDIDTGDGDNFDVGTLSDGTDAPVAPPAAPSEAPATPAAAPTTPAAAPSETPATPTTPAAVPGTPAAPAAPAAPATPAAPVPPTATAAAAPAAPVLPPAGPQPVPPPEPQPAQTLEQAVEVRNKWRNDTIDALAAGHYNLSEAQVEEIQTTPEVTIPKMMARVYLDATEAATMGVMQHLPRVITGVMQRMQEAETAEKDFYAAWPALDRTKHHDAVMQLATAYRQLNQNASKDDFIKFVGSQAIVALGLTQAVAPPPVAPAAPGAPPFRPLAGSAPATRPHQPPQVSPFAQFAEEDLEYDKGD